jgi:hypothetical protein
MPLQVGAIRTWAFERVSVTEWERGKRCGVTAKTIARRSTIPFEDENHRYRKSCGDKSLYKVQYRKDPLRGCDDACNRRR